MKRAINIRFSALIIFLAIAMIPLAGQNQGQGQGQRQGQGQGRQMSEEDIKTRVSSLAKSLELTKTQEKNILDFELKEFQKTKAMREGFSREQATQAEREAMRSKMGESRVLREKKYKEVMTKEQYEKYEKERDERMQQRQQPSDKTPAQQGERPPRGRGRG